MDEAEKKEACPKCAGPIATGEKFCAACGYQLQVTPAEARDLGQRIGLKHAKKTFQENVSSGRRTILVLAILIAIIAVGLFVFVPSLESEIKKTLSDIRSKKGNVMYDQQKVLEAEKKLEGAEGMLTLAAVIVGIEAATFFGLWIWAKSRPLAATLTALIIWLSGLLFNVITNPAGLLNPIALLIHGVIILSLIRAVSSAQKYQKLQQQGI